MSRVLIVDDAPVDRKLASKLLERRGDAGEPHERAAEQARLECAKGCAVRRTRVCKRHCAAHDRGGEAEAAQLALGRMPLELDQLIEVFVHSP